MCSLTLLQTPEEKYHRILLTFFSVTLANVTRLNLSSCNLNIPGAEVLGNVLKKNTALLHLDLSFNSLGKGGMKQLAAGLIENTKLEVRLLRRLSGGECAVSSELILTIRSKFNQQQLTAGSTKAYAEAFCSQL